MPKIIKQDTDWDFIPSLESLVRATDANAASGAFGIYREGHPLPLGIVTKRYKVVTNRELVDRARAILTKLGFKGWTEKLISINHGARFMGVFSIRNSLVPKTVGDTIGYRIILGNSFDTSSKATAMGGFERLICSNGAATLEEAIALAGRHDANIDLSKLEEAIERVVTGLDGQATIFTRLMEKAITNEQGNVILKNLVVRKLIANRLREEIEGEWLNPRFKEDSDRNLYNLYNAATYVLTHKVAETRFEQSNEINAAILMQFRDAVMKADKLAALLTVPPEKGPDAAVVVTP